MDENKFPELTQQPILIIDMTPNDELPLRILQAYRTNCNCNWATSSNGTCENPLFAIMNEHNKQRANILDNAILKLEK
jgi:hypothetical protein